MIPSLKISEGLIPEIFFPDKVTSPLFGFNKPLITRNTVLLPAPFGPTMQVIDPFLTSKLKPCKTIPPP